MDQRNPKFGLRVLQDPHGDQRGQGVTHDRQVYPFIGGGREAGQFKGQRRRLTPVDQPGQGGAEKYGNREGAIFPVTRANRLGERSRVSTAGDEFQIVFRPQQAFRRFAAPSPRPLPSRASARRGKALWSKYSRSF